MTNYIAFNMGDRTVGVYDSDGQTYFVFANKDGEMQVNNLPLSVEELDSLLLACVMDVSR